MIPLAIDAITNIRSLRYHDTLFNIYTYICIYLCMKIGRTWLPLQQNMIPAALASHSQAADQSARVEYLDLDGRNHSRSVAKTKAGKSEILYISGFEGCFCVQVACHVS